MALKSLTELVSDSLKAARPSGNAMEVRFIRSLQQVSSIPPTLQLVCRAELVGSSAVQYTLVDGALEKLYGELIPDFIANYGLGYMGLLGTLRLLDGLVSFRDPKTALALMVNGDGRYLVQLEELLRTSTPMGRAMAGLYTATDGTLWSPAEQIGHGSLRITQDDADAFQEWLDDHSGEDEEFRDHSWYLLQVGEKEVNYGDFDALYAFLHCIVKDKRDRFVFRPTFRNGETNYNHRTEQLDMRYKDASSLTPYGFIVSKQFSNHYIRFFNHAGVELSGDYYSQAHALRSIYERFTGQPQTHQTLDWARTWTDEDCELLNLTPSPQKEGDDTRLIAANGFFYSDL